MATAEQLARIEELSERAFTAGLCDERQGKVTRRNSKKSCVF
jgi:hypothetical protein